MQFRAPFVRLAAMGGVAVIALLGIVPDPDPVTAPVSPAILWITFSPERLRAGVHFEVTIHTTPDITAVDAMVMKYKLSVPRTGEGVFTGTGRVPWWARIYHGTFHVMFIGTAPTGEQPQMEADVRI
jgi:hypothetical protein